jgi:hypothetical protein
MGRQHREHGLSSQPAADADLPDGRSAEYGDEQEKQGIQHGT